MALALLQNKELYVLFFFLNWNGSLAYREAVHEVRWKSLGTPDNFIISQSVPHSGNSWNLWATCLYPSPSIWCWTIFVFRWSESCFEAQCCHSSEKMQRSKKTKLLISSLKCPFSCLASYVYVGQRSMILANKFCQPIISATGFQINLAIRLPKCMCLPNCV